MPITTNPTIERLTATYAKFSGQNADKLAKYAKNPSSISINRMDSNSFPGAIQMVTQDDILNAGFEDLENALYDKGFRLDNVKAVASHYITLDIKQIG